MSTAGLSRRRTTWNALQRLAGGAGRATAAPDPREHCELCGVPLAAQHRHLLEVAVRRVVCACDACALRFHDVVGGRFKLIPRDAHPLPDFQMTPAQWETLALPIDLAFFFRSTPAEKIVALYPGPAGAIESLLALETWDALVAANPVLGRMQADVEALLVNRVGGTGRYFLAPIDACYQLVGLIRLNWRGLAGGVGVWREISAFFSQLEGRHPAGTTPAVVTEAAHA